MGRNIAIRMAACAAALTGAAALLRATPFGPGPGYAGAPGEQTCAQCHGGGAINNGGGSIALNVSSYKPGLDQHVVVTIKDAAAQRWGFEATPLIAKDNTAAGSLRATDANAQVVSNGPLRYIEHTLAGNRTGTTGSITFEFDWTPPSSNVGDVMFYVAANAANGNGAADAGDHVYVTSFVLQAASTTGAPSIRPFGVVNGASFLAGVSPGAWVSIFGDNLASTTRTWRANEIVNLKLPSALDGVRVMINNKPAAVSYISPTQLNVQAPDDDATEREVQVQVANDKGTAQQLVTLERAAPAFFKYSQDGGQYVAAQHADYSPVGHTGLIPNANVSPAKPGEVIILYGTGFGPTSPATPAGQIVITAYEIDKSQLTVQIGGADAEVQFAGVTQAGVWQINVKVPDDLPDGDAIVVPRMGRQPPQDVTLVTIGR